MEADPSALVVEASSPPPLPTTTGTDPAAVESRRLRLRSSRGDTPTTTSDAASSAASAMSQRAISSSVPHEPSLSAMEAAADNDDGTGTHADDDDEEYVYDDSNSLVAVPLGAEGGSGTRDNSNGEQQRSRGRSSGATDGNPSPSASSSSSSSSVSFPSSSTATADDVMAGNESAGDRGCRCLRHSFRLLFFPVFVVVSIAGLVLFLLFFCFPLLVFFLLLICVYYCCTDEPIPPRVLFRALWEDNTDTLGAAANGGLGGAAQAASPYSVDEILAKIVSRRLLSVSPIRSKDDRCEDASYGLGSAVVNVRSDPSHDGPVYLTDHDATVLLHFSPPIVTTVTKEPSTDEAGASGGDGGAAGGGGGVDDDDENDDDENDENDGSDAESNAAAAASIDVELAEAAEREVRGWENSASAASDEAPPSTTMTMTMTAPPHALHPLACDICLCEFDQGDVLSWSRNRHCQHHFHRDCIVDWLRRRTTCPSCRQEFVQP